MLNKQTFNLKQAIY